MIRFGCLGAARITPRALVLPIAGHEDAEIVAVASRDADRARAFAEENTIAHIETDYEALIARPDVDAIYNALPPHLHARLTILALEAGKPVLCEKPMAMNAAEAGQMAKAAERTGVLLMEAFHYRFHPAFMQALEIIRNGDLGRLQTFTGRFSVDIAEKDGELRHELALGGGALMDLGCYPLHWARTVLAGEPEIVSATAKMGRAGIDLYVQAKMVFDQGVTATIMTSMEETTERQAMFRIIGSDARLQFDNPIAPHLGYKVSLMPTDTKEAIIVAEDGPNRQTTYHYQLDHFLSCLKGETTPLLLPADGVANMTAIDAIYRTAGMVPRGMIT